MFEYNLTNPPYVTSGSGLIKRQIGLQGLDKYYTIGGRAVEALSIEWIVNNLKEGGECFVVLPDRLLNQKSVIDYLFKKCNVQAIVSLPIRTSIQLQRKLTS